MAHHSYLAQGTFLSCGVNMGAGVVAKRYAYCSMGCNITTGVKVLGEGCVIGAGSVVLHDVEDHAVVAGVPARVIRDVLGA